MTLNVRQPPIADTRAFWNIQLLNRAQVFGMMALLLLASLGISPESEQVPPPGTPPPPPAPRRSGPAPEYSVDCRLLGRKGELARLTLEVRNGPLGRVAFVSASTPRLAYLRGSATATSSSWSDWNGHFTQVDSLLFSTSGDQIDVELTVQDQMSASKIEVRSPKNSFDIPVAVGMCSTTFR